MRTPSYDVAELERQIGPRGSVSVDSSNRSLIQNWLVAQGVPSSVVKSMRLETLRKAYNFDHYLQAIIRARGVPEDMRHEGELPQEEGEDEGDEGDASEAEASEGEGEQEQQETKPEEEQSALEREIARLVKKHAPKANGTEHTITIKRPDHAPVTLEGKQHPCFERVLKLVSAGANVLLIGPAGCGKTHMSEQIAKALRADYGAIHGSAGASESALTGWLLPVDGGKFEYAPSRFVELYASGNSLFLFDELDAFDPNMLLVVNGALANGHLHIAHRRHEPMISRGKDVRIIATANTYGTGANPMYSGRNPLDAATLDRFVPVTMDYDKALEQSIAASVGVTKEELAAIWALRDKVRNANLRRVISTRAIQCDILESAGYRVSIVNGFGGGRLDDSGPERRRVANQMSLRVTVKDYDKPLDELTAASILTPGFFRALGFAWILSVNPSKAYRGLISHGDVATDDGDMLLSHDVRDQVSAQRWLREQIEGVNASTPHE